MEPIVAWIAIKSDAGRDWRPTSAPLMKGQSRINYGGTPRSCGQPSYPNWQRKRIQNPCSVSSNLTEGTSVNTYEIFARQSLERRSEQAKHCMTANTIV